MSEAEMSGKVVLVTGAGRGLGRATALRFADLGASLCLVDINTEGLAETRELIGSSVESIVHAADLIDPAACRVAVDVAVEHFGRLDALCNIAGIFLFAHSSEMPSEDWRRTFAINLDAPFHLAQAAIPHLLQTNGAIVSVASSAGIVAKAYAAAYCASKAGLIAMTKSLAMEYARKPIRINVVAPGTMPSNAGSWTQLPEDVDRDLVQRYYGFRDPIPSEDVADAIVMLASDRGRSYHGACLAIDGGFTAG